jgi:hypothetical protein
MNEDVRAFFRELADLSASEREDYYELRQVPAALRAELESLLSFDRASGDSLSSLVGSAAEQLLGSNVPAPQGDTDKELEPPK